MREIKFRAWDRKRRRMVPEVQETFEDADFGAYLQDSDFVVMQYTGLKDIEGVEVFEGDLFGVKNLSDELEVVGEVIFDTDLAQFTIKYTNGGWAELWQHLNERKNRAREVIGNIWENGDLLK